MATNSFLALGFAAFIGAMSGQATSAPTERPTSRPDDLASIEKTLLERLPGLHSLTARADTDFSAAQAEEWIRSKSTGPLEYLIKDGKVMSRYEAKIETTTVSAGEETMRKDEQIQLNDGDYYYTVGREQGKK